MKNENSHFLHRAAHWFLTLLFAFSLGVFISTALIEFTSIGFTHHFINLILLGLASGIGCMLALDKLAPCMEKQ